MLKVFKYQVEVSDYPEIDMKIGAHILSFQVQQGGLCIWAIVNPDGDDEVRRFRLVGTGHEINEPERKLKYIGTTQMLEGRVLFHLFELIGCDE